ncbi:MAG TPA: glutathione S-transferase N-terminal domain-containing protein, partial [Rhodanobacteraceae bacterium]|nr:glutathione S-transferase N-terminal domain-containing protein [Rhodanobacteraceae bacterium]
PQQCRTGAVALVEKDLIERTELVVVDPWADAAALAAVNPLLQVPTLVRDDGLALTNSDTIMAWFERAHPQPALWPDESDALTRAQAVAALAQGLLEYAVYIVLERRKPAGQRGEAMIQRRIDGIVRTVQALEQRFALSERHFHLDAIGVACALAYLDFRLPECDWRGEAPGLGRWLAVSEQRPSMRATVPPTQ